MKVQLHRTIAGIAPRIARGEIGPTAVVRECLARIESRRELNAFTMVLADSALADAEEAENAIARGNYLGPLHGIPVSIKDLVDVAGVPTTSGSAVPPRHPSADAPVVGRLREAGAIIIGKTNLHEFAFGTTSDESAFGPVRNPYDPSRSAGGSSGGAAVALVEGMCLGSIGTDTGGSIRIPSAACGVVGLKPTYGELPVDGIVPLSATCDHVGPMALSVADVGIMFDALTGSVSSEPPVEAAVTFGVPAGYLLERLDGEVRAAFERARRALAAGEHRVVDVALEHSRSTSDAYVPIVLFEAARYHASMLAAHAARYSPGVRARLEKGRDVSADDYAQGMRLRERLREDVDRALGSCDALLLPALAIPAPTIGARTVDLDGQPEPVRAAMLRLTQLFNLTGHPAIVLPAGATSSGLPIGIQLVGHLRRTNRLLALASDVERQMTSSGS